MYHIDYKHFKTIQFRIMPPIMPPFYFVTHKLRELELSFFRNLSIAKISSLLTHIAKNETF